MSDTTDATAGTDPASYATAADLGTEHRARRAAIEADANLSAIERGRMLAELDVEQGRRLEAIKVADRQAQAQAQAGRWIAAFGTDPADLDSRRAADDWAMTLATPDDAAAALERAEMMGDEVRARAIGEQAWHHVRASPLAAIRPGPWGAVLDLYRSTRPEADAALDELMPTANPRRSAIARRMGLEMLATTEATR